MNYESKEHLDSYQEFLEWYRKDDEELEQNEPNDSDDAHKYWLYMPWLAGRKAAQAVPEQEHVGTVQCINGVTIGYLDVKLAVNTKLYTSVNISTPEQEPFGWMNSGSDLVFKGPYADLDAKSEAKRIGGTCCAFPIYLKGN